MKRPKTAIFMVLLIAALCRPASSDDKTNLLLESIGHFSSQSVYLTYIAIGTVSDGHAKQVYSKETADELLGKLVGLCSAAVGQLNKLLSSGAMAGEDIQFTSKLIDTFNLLSAQAASYRNFTRTGDTSHIKIFTEKRQEAWKNIKSLLGIQEEG